MKNTFFNPDFFEIFIFGLFSLTFFAYPKSYNKARTPKGADKIQTVYADLLFLINFSMDFLCVFLVAKLTSKRLSYPRAIAGAVLGGAYSVAILFMPPLGRLEIIPDILCCLLMCLIVFARKGDTLGTLALNTVTYLLASVLLGGIMTAAFNLLNSSGIDLEGTGEGDIPPWLLVTVGLASVISTYAGGHFLKRRAAERQAEIDVTLCDVTVTIRAMCDSGNLLRDSVSGRAVIVADNRHTSSFFKKRKEITAKDAITLDGDIRRRIALIPCSTANGSGTMVAFRPQKVIVRTDRREKEVDALIGFAEIKCAAPDCSALIPPELL